MLTVLPQMPLTRILMAALENAHYLVRVRIRLITHDHRADR